MNSETLAAFIGILPQLILVVVGATLAIWYRHPLGVFLSTHIGSVSMFGIKVDLLASDVDKAVTAKTSEAELASDPLTQTSNGQRLAERANRLATRLAGHSVLWVDDHPDRNHLERRLLNKLGLFVDVALGNDEAMRLLKNETYAFDLVISDIKRDDGSSGRDLPGLMDALPVRPQVIFYVFDLDPKRDTPAGAHGITARPDVLLDLVMDVLDRLPERTR